MEKKIEQKDGNGKPVLNDKEIQQHKAEREAVNNEIEHRASFEKVKMESKPFVDTKLSEPLEGRVEQGVPIGKDLQAETKISDV